MLLDVNSSVVEKSQLAQSATVGPVVEQRTKQKFPQASAVATFDVIPSACRTNTSSFVGYGGHILIHNG